IVVSRAHPEMVKKLFSVEVPEIQNGTVDIKAVAREAGHRTKIAVASTQPNIDPIGSCVGQRGSRVQTVINELGGEKVDIIEWSDDPVAFIGNALSPAKVISISLDEASHTAKVEVKEDQLSLAIGKAGQNVRLAAKLSGWRIDIVGEGGEPRPAADAVAAPTDAAPEATAETPAEPAAPEVEAPAEAKPEEPAPAAEAKAE
ncbi:MAG: transcription termination/antitermination protein NusA, partial [Patescibacteria group bacterium]